MKKIICIFLIQLFILLGVNSIFIFGGGGTKNYHYYPSGYILNSDIEFKGERVESPFEDGKFKNINYGGGKNKKIPMSENFFDVYSIPIDQIIAGRDVCPYTDEIIYDVEFFTGYTNHGDSQNPFSNHNSRFKSDVDSLIEEMENWEEANEVDTEDGDIHISSTTSNQAAMIATFIFIAMGGGWVAAGLALLGGGSWAALFGKKIKNHFYTPNIGSREITIPPLNCKEMKDLYYKVRIPESWSNSEFEVFCHQNFNKDLNQSSFYDDFGLISEYSLCIVKNLNLTEDNNTIIYSYMFGNREINLDNDKYSNILVSNIKSEGYNIIDEKPIEDATVSVDPDEEFGIKKAIYQIYFDKQKELEKWRSLKNDINYIISVDPRGVKYNESSDGDYPLTYPNNRDFLHSLDTSTPIEEVYSGYLPLLEELQENLSTSTYITQIDSIISDLDDLDEDPPNNTTLYEEIEKLKNIEENISRISNINLSFYVIPEDVLENLDITLNDPDFTFISTTPEWLNSQEGKIYYSEYDYMRNLEKMDLVNSAVENISSFSTIDISYSKLYELESKNFDLFNSLEKRRVLMKIPKSEYENNNIDSISYQENLIFNYDENYLPQNVFNGFEQTTKNKLKKIFPDVLKHSGNFSLKPGICDSGGLEGAEGNFNFYSAAYHDFVICVYTYLRFIDEVRYELIFNSSDDPTNYSLRIYEKEGFFRFSNVEENENDVYLYTIFENDEVIINPKTHNLILNQQCNATDCYRFSSHSDFYEQGDEIFVRKDINGINSENYCDLLNHTLGNSGDIDCQNFQFTTKSSFGGSVFLNVLEALTDLTRYE